MALYAASHQGLITATLVPNSAELFLNDGEPFDAGVPLEMSDYRALLRAGGNQVRSSFTLSALQTQRELESAFGPALPADPPGKDSSQADLWAARSVLKLIADSVGHDLMAPIWRVPEASRGHFAIPQLGISLDASGRRGQGIRWGDFGGLPSYLNLTLFVSYCLDGMDTGLALQAAITGSRDLTPWAEGRSGSVPPVSPVDADAGYGSGSGRLRRRGPAVRYADADASAGWIAPDGPTEPRVAVAAQATEMGSIDEFVTGACSTGAKAMNLAGDLYTSYAKWCLDNGYLAHSQRKFGLELRARGYQRKRRGKGRHWWIGVESRV